jgi:hypothetical protein
MQNIYFCFTPLGALFKSIILFNRFKKCCFLKSVFFCLTDLKSALKGGKQKKYFARENLKGIFCREVG